MDLLIDNHTGLLYRPDTSDVATLREYKKVKRYFKWFDGLTVLDMGSNIGVFTYYSLKHNAKKVIAYEPEADNCEIFELQKFRDTKLIHGAITDKNKDVYLTLKNTNGHTIVEKQGLNLDKIKIKGLSFYDQITKYDPDVVKVDIEGAELDLDFSVLKPNTILIIEVHHVVDAKRAGQLMKNIYRDYTTKFQTQTHKAKTDEPYQTVYVGIRKC